MNDLTINDIARMAGYRGNAVMFGSLPEPYERFRDEEKPISVCAYCEEDIYEGEEVYIWEETGEYIHEDCIEEFLETRFGLFRTEATRE